MKTSFVLYNLSNTIERARRRCGSGAVAGGSRGVTGVHVHGTPPGPDKLPLTLCTNSCRGALGPSYEFFSCDACLPPADDAAAAASSVYDIWGGGGGQPCSYELIPFESNRKL